jgi:hypothetical protein
MRDIGGGGGEEEEELLRLRVLRKRRKKRKKFEKKKFQKKNSSYRRQEGQTPEPRPRPRQPLHGLRPGPPPVRLCRERLVVLSLPPAGGASRDRRAHHRARRRDRRRHFQDLPPLVVNLPGGLDKHPGDPERRRDWGASDRPELRRQPRPQSDGRKRRRT